MEDVTLIRKLKSSGRIEQTLKKGSNEKTEIKVLQQLLHHLGFDGPLQWNTYGADGDYGGCTSRAVRAFAQQNGINADGSVVTLEIANALIKAAETMTQAHESAASNAGSNQVKLGRTVLERGATGAEVAELQIRLAGFRGTIWDGEFGAGTELQIRTFQRDYMGSSEPTGVADPETYMALQRFANTYSIDFGKVACPCGQCGGYGQGQFSNQYREGKPEIEAFHKREYPGVHKAILHSFRAARFYADSSEEAPFFLTCGYRCWINNARNGRKSTNHMGKALDCDFQLQNGEDKRDDQNRCDRFRGVLAEKANFQIGWAASNRKALEPSAIAPTWIHMDVRQYSRRYLDDRYFVRSLEELDGFDL